VSGKNGTLRVDQKQRSFMKAFNFDIKSD